MGPEQYAAIGGLVTICAAAFALIIKQLEQSRCSKIKLLCGCIDCDRAPPVDPMPERAAEEQP